MDIFIHNSVTATIYIIQNKINTVDDSMKVFTLAARINVRPFRQNISLHTQIHTQLQIGRRLRDGGLITK